MNTKYLIEEAISLPIEERAKILDSLLKSLNTHETDIDKKWADLARKRLTELRLNNSVGIPVDEVFRKIWKGFSA